MVDKSYYNQEMPVSEETLDEIRQLGMAGSIQRVMAGDASPEFVEAVRRFYPAVVDQIDSTVNTGSEMPKLDPDLPMPSGPDRSSASPVPGQEAMARRALQGDAPVSHPSMDKAPVKGGQKVGGYTPGSKMERDPNRQDKLNDMTGLAFAVQNALGMVGPEQAQERGKFLSGGLAPGANPGGPAGEAPPGQGVEHPMDRSLISKILGLTSAQQNAPSGPPPPPADPNMDRSQFGPGGMLSGGAGGGGGGMPPEMIEALKRRMGGMAGGGRLQ